MAKNSKEVESLIPDKVAEPSEQPFVPARVAVSESLPDWEQELLVFGFRDYNQKECEIHNFEKKDAKNFTSKLSTISQVTVLQFRQTYVRDTVHNSGNYKSLFDNLPDLTQLLEVEFTASGRVFGFIEQNRFQVVAICKKHR